MSDPVPPELQSNRPTERTHEQEPQPGAASFQLPDGSTEERTLQADARPGETTAARQNRAADSTWMNDPGRDSEATPGLEPGGGVAPGDTPPAAGSESQAAEDRHTTPNQGPAVPSRRPNVIGIVAVVILVIGVVGLAVAEIVARFAN